MHIAIDGTALYGRYGGVEYSLWNLLGALGSIDSTNRYTVYIPHDGPPPERLRSFSSQWNWIRLPFEGAQKVRRIHWQQVLLPRRLRQDGCDLLHAPTYVAPLQSPIPVVLTIYDLIALSHPEFATAANRLHYGALLPRCIANASRVVVPTEAVRGEVEKRVPVAAVCTRVVPLGVEPVFLQAGETPIDEDVRATMRCRYTLPERYLLFVGNFEPKKNLRRLLDALDLVLGTPPLVVAGGARAWRGYEIEEQPEHVHTIGYVRRVDLPALYTMCEAFVFPSLAEGFGLPVLEAMACGAPVITSNAVPLPDLDEVTLMCDPHDTQSIAAQLSRVLSDGDLRQKLSRAGTAYARPYTWRRTAEMTLCVYGEAAGVRR